MTRSASGLLALLLAAGCGGTEQPPPKVAKPSSQPASGNDDEVRLAVFRYLLARHEVPCETPDPSQPNAFYLAIGTPGGVVRTKGGIWRCQMDEDPSDAVMTATGPRRYPVKRLSQCDTDTGQCLDKLTGKPGIVLWVGSIKWLDAETAVLMAGEWQHLLGARGDRLRVRRRGDRWEIVETGPRWVS